MASDDIKRVLVKAAAYGGLIWAAWKIVEGLSKKQTPSQIVKETVKPIETAAKEVKKVTKKFLKGSPEAKAHMAKLREKAKGVKRGEGKRAKRKAAQKNQTGHKGHKTKKGLALDQEKKSQEPHEKSYRKSKRKK